jgi:hypothetical protein
MTTKDWDLTDDPRHRHRHDERETGGCGNFINMWKKGIVRRDRILGSFAFLKGMTGFWSWIGIRVVTMVIVIVFVILFLVKFVWKSVRREARVGVTTRRSPRLGVDRQMEHAE